MPVESNFIKQFFLSVSRWTALLTALSIGSLVFGSTNPAALSSSHSIAPSFETENLPLRVTPQDYSTKISALYAKAIKTGSIRYFDVAHIVYQDALPDVIEEKKIWQNTYQNRFIFYSDYSCIERDVTIQNFAPRRNSQLSSTLVGRYGAISDKIEVASNASPFVIIHESGHALQRARLRNPQVTAQLHQLSPAAPSKQRDFLRITYLLGQNEFEIRLQDLNRFYALNTSGGTISSPIDAIEALRFLGLTLEQSYLQQALAGSKWADQTTALNDKNRPQSVFTRSEIKTYFEDANELILLRKLTLRHTPGKWPQILAKILFEAPGHL